MRLLQLERLVRLATPAMPPLSRIDYFVPYKKISEDIALQYIQTYHLVDDIHMKSLLEQANLEKYGLRELHRLLEKKKKTSLDILEFSC